MTFAYPAWFWSLALLPLLALLFWAGEKRRRRALQALVAARLAPVLAGEVSVWGRRLRFALVLLGLAAVIVALAQPRWGFEEHVQKTRGRDILIAIDTSRSMLANDVAPSRLARAKLAAQDLIGKVNGDRVGLIAFAGSAFLQAPLTVDYSAVLSSVRELDTNIIPMGGTNIAEAIQTATEAFGKGESDQRALILISDGEELSEDGAAAARHAASAMRIYTLGVGSPQGTVIALPGSDGATTYIKSPDGQIVRSKLDETRMQQIAEGAGGFYQRLENGPAAMDRIIREGLDQMSAREATAPVLRRPLERYGWPLTAGLVLLGASLLPGERRRLKQSAPVAVALLAMLWAPLAAWGRNAGVEAYDRQDYAGALDSFQNQLEKKPESPALQFDAGAAAYKSGDYDKALDSFSKALASREPQLREKAEYSLGNTLLERGAAQTEKAGKLKDWKNSVQHYEQALKMEPRDGDAQYNLEVLKKLIAELEKEPPKQDQQKKDQQEKKPDQQEKKDQQKSQDQKDQEQKNQGQQDQQKPSSGGSGQQNQQQPNGESGQPDQQAKNGPKEGKPQDKKGDAGDQKQDQTAQGDQSKETAGQPKDEASPPTPRKLDGQVSDAPPKGAGKTGDEKQEAAKTDERQAEEDALAAAADKMTPAQAASLLDSLKDADRRVQLLKPHQKATEGPIRDW